MLLYESPDAQDAFLPIHVHRVIHHVQWCVDPHTSSLMMCCKDQIVLAHISCYIDLWKSSSYEKCSKMLVMVTTLMNIELGWILDYCSRMAKVLLQAWF